MEDGSLRGMTEVMEDLDIAGKDHRVIEEPKP